MTAARHRLATSHCCKVLHHSASNIETDFHAVTVCCSVVAHHATIALRDCWQTLHSTVKSCSGKVKS